MIDFWLHEYEDVLGEVFGDGEGLGDWDDLGIPPNSPRRASYGSASGAGSGSSFGFAGDSFNSPPSPRGHAPGSGGDFGGEVPMPKAAERDDRAWNALGEIMRARTGREEDEISDSESVVSVGELGEGARMDDGRSEGEDGSGVEDEGEAQRQRRRSQNESTWAVSFLSPSRISLDMMG